MEQEQCDQACRRLAAGNARRGGLRTLHAVGASGIVAAVELRVVEAAARGGPLAGGRVAGTITIDMRADGRICRGTR